MVVVVFMNRYKIFLKSGETVEVEADKVLSIIDEPGHIYRYDFVEINSKGMLKLKAAIYNNTIDGWTELPESEEGENE